MDKQEMEALEKMLELKIQAALAVQAAPAAAPVAAPAAAPVAAPGAGTLQQVLHDPQLRIVLDQVEKITDKVLKVKEPEKESDAVGTGTLLAVSAGAAIVGGGLALLLSWAFSDPAGAACTAAGAVA